MVIYIFGFPPGVMAGTAARARVNPGARPGGGRGDWARERVKQTSILCVQT